MNDNTKPFRLIGYSEGISFLVLLGIAMPLKYFAGIPEGVKVVGWIHGLLFMLYLGAAVSLSQTLNWPKRLLFLACIAAVIPFGPFIFDKKFLPPRSV